ncbi:putative conserved oligomeric Golgi complex subunit 5-like [Trypanosoma grayi]|uniref:putative conserved oligomeric Golgi complex subunit 5-like n=1 Tax=Trypanosoma grayi TaxID=71804 RepID=UPI0004F43111|nr:putative conserved oligomeric Golgi complex subunit 5-like [Trypanosoma grayi]KEG10891.1 putative conserved oligomeric Golgi complex subunit 5-like [Trypanosoma grayi]
MFTDSMLMSPDFDEEAYLRYALHASNCQAEQARLASCAKAVREDVHKILSENAEDMVQQVTAACRAQRDVAAVRQATSFLVQSTSRLRHTIQEPHRVINASITKLENTNAALNFLRNILKFIGLTTRLKSQLPHDLARAARTLREVEELMQSSSITGIEVVDARIEAVERAAVTIRTRAQEMLRRGDAQDASSVAVPLQCFFTLGNLPRVLSSLMTEQKREVIKSLMRDLDLQTMTDEINHGDNSSANDISARTRDVFFSRLQSALTNTTQHTQVVVAVWRVLVKKLDPVTHTPYLSVVENPTSALGDYWHLVTEKLRERLQAAQKRPNFLAVMAADVLQYRNLLHTFLGNMRGLLDVLDRLMEMDAAAMKRAGRPSSPVNASPGGVEQVKRTWLSQVTQEVNERFAAHITDRHRERLHHILSKLPSIIPTASSRPVVNAVVDLDRPQVPAAAYVLDTRGYTAMATQDVTSYRQDPHTLSIVLECILQCLAAFMQPVTEAMSKWPLPPLPSVSGDPTGPQMLHICVSNACTLLSNDLVSMLASLPEEELFAEDRVTGRWLSGGMRRTDQEKGSRDETASNARENVMEKHRQLSELADKLKSISKNTLDPFFSSASVLLLGCVSMCVDGSLGQEAAGVRQLQSQIRHFMSHFYYLFEPQTPTLDENVRRITDSLLARLIVTVTLVCPYTTGKKQHVVGCLQQVSRVVLSFGPTNTHGTMGRSTMSLKGQLHQLTVWYELSEDVSEKSREEWHTFLAMLPPVVARLLLLQRVPQNPAKGNKPHVAMGVTSESFVEIVEAALLEQARVGQALQNGVGGTNSGAEATTRLGDAMTALETCFHEAATAARADPAGEPMVRWAEEQWGLMQG